MESLDTSEAEVANTLKGEEVSLKSESILSRVWLIFCKVWDCGIIDRVAGGNDTVTQRG